MEQERGALNNFMVSIFNDILRIEEDALTCGPFQNLSLREIHLIEAVVDGGTNNTAKQIANALGITQGSLTTAVSTLEKKGYLLRKSGERDKRLVTIWPTPLARVVYTHHLQFHQDLVQAVTEHLGARELEGFAQGLTAVGQFFQSKQFLSQIRRTTVKTIILTDSTSDIEPDFAAELGVEILPLSVIFGEKTYRDGVDLTKAQFYALQATSEHFPTTSQINPEGFLSFFETCKANEQEVVYIGISSKLSGTMQSAIIAKDMCDYEGIYLIDTLQASFGEQIFVEAACKMRDEGKSAREIATLLQSKVDKAHLFAAVDTLKYLIQGGRLSKTAGAVGSMLNLKPLITLNDGTLISFDKVRGRTNAFKALVKAMDQYEMDTDMPIVLTHTNSPESVTEFSNFLKEEGFDFTYNTAEVGSVIGAHVGPGCVGIAFFSK